MSQAENKCCCLSPATRIRMTADLHQRYSTSDDDSGCVMDEYAWVPSGVKPDVIHNYFASLPLNKVPFANSVGEQWRLKQLGMQLPLQDCEPRYCGNLTAAEEIELNAFEKARKKECLGRGLIRQLPLDNNHPKIYCHQCKIGIGFDELVISSPERFENRAFWHPRCFVCVECKELLVDLIYYKHNENVFCGRHHAEQLRPRCASCDELIFSEECTEAEGRVWHMKHFICRRCDCQLGGQQYIMHDSMPLCLPCYHFANRLQCNTCRKEIIAERPYINQGTISWHADERCFCCSICERNLLARKYSFCGGELFCGVDKCSRVAGPTFPPLPVPSPAPSVPYYDGGGHSITTPSPCSSLTPPSSSSAASSATSTAVSRVRFNLRPPPRRSPPPTPTSTLPQSTSTSSASPSENVYETVMAAVPTPSAPPAPPILKRIDCRDPVVPIAPEGTGAINCRGRRRGRARLCSRSSSSTTSSLCSLDDAYCRRESGPQGVVSGRQPPRCRSADGRRRRRGHARSVRGGRQAAFMVGGAETSKDTKRDGEAALIHPNTCTRTPLQGSVRQKEQSGRKSIYFSSTHYSMDTSSSDSDDADDIYLSNYMAALSLDRPRIAPHLRCVYSQCIAGGRNRAACKPAPQMAMASRAKTKTADSNNCIVS